MGLRKTSLRAAALTGLSALAIAGLPNTGQAQAAAGGTVSLQGTKLVYVAAPGASSSAGISLFNGEIAVFDTAPLASGPGCRQLTPRAVACGTAVTEFTATMGDLNDSLSVGAPINGTVDGGDGQDGFLAGTKSARPRSITFIGGTGTDTVSYRGSDLSVRVSLDNNADDGRNIDSDDIRSDVENIVGTPHGGDILVGNSGRNTIDGVSGPGDQLYGEGGPDRLLAKDLDRETALDCGGGGGDEVVMDEIDPAPVGCEIVRKL
ncbi:hypothetical protein Ppa06_43580 [Planomonospora parontospora subsp. parontospora]|uniref:Calcium-binding protein n=2 Tax=Planomonospora parontospora TaxID=58119 RepID=A0AA37F6G2_9ACTN|nr:hypothetical protein [Planomonospora parontospora]GGK84291.1 hypothetical protein GCM10010126_49430 [Planomonospora parontospora]GII10560.1 hypothetical protein Ppa06_43580 [Planomonospora parontospora subsp. parontospora]